MDLRARRRLRWAAWLAFVVLVPVVLAYARGYRGAPFVLGRPSLAVGALVVRTVPRGASVAIDGRIVDERTPAGIGGVPAGAHAIRVEKPGYRPYEKRVTVEGGRVADLLHLRLVPAAITPDVVRAGVTGVWRSPDGQWTLLREGTPFRLLRTRDLDDLAGTGAPPSGGLGRLLRLPARPGEDLVVLWAPDSEAFAIGVRRPRTSPGSVAVVEAATGRVEPLPSRSALVGWAATGKQRVVLLQPDGRLVGRAVGREAAGAPVALAEGVGVAAIHPRGVLVQRNSPADALTLELVSERGVVQGIRPPLGSAADALAVSASGNVAALLTGGGGIAVLPRGESAWERHGERVQDTQWSPDGDKLLYQESDFDLWVLNVSEDRSSLPRGRPHLLLRLSDPLRNPQWFPDSQHVLFQVHDILRLAEIDPRPPPRTEDLVSSNRGGTTVAVDPNTDALWLTARREDQDVLLRVFLRTPEDR